MPVQYEKEGDKHVNIRTTMYIVVKYNKYLNIWTGWKKMFDELFILNQ